MCVRSLTKPSSVDELALHRANVLACSLLQTVHVATSGVCQPHILLLGALPAVWRPAAMFNRPIRCGGCMTGGVSVHGESHSTRKTCSWMWLPCRRQPVTFWAVTTSPPSRTTGGHQVKPCSSLQHLCQGYDSQSIIMSWSGAA